MTYGYASLSTFLEPINSELMAILQSGTWSQWTKTWSSDKSFLSAQNILSGTVYKGSNIFICGYWQRRRGYSTNLWATAKQLADNGYYAKKVDLAYNGFVSLFSPNLRSYEDKETGEKKTKMQGVKAFTVVNFSTETIGETPNATMSVAERIQEWRKQNQCVRNPNISPIDTAQHLLDAYRSSQNIGLIPGEPAYFPGLDQITMPAIDQFTSSEAYYGTYAHECAHSTGHNSRLDRIKSTVFGSPEYAYEELIAELCAVYLCAHLGIQYDLQRHASYLGSWLVGLQSDVGYFVKAANAAQKAMEYVLEHSHSQVTERELVTA